MQYDTIIIGKGPAGISAALYIVRAGYRTLVIGSGRGSLERAELIDNYYGFSEPQNGAALVDNGISQARRIGAEILDAEVTGISIGEGFSVKTADAEYTTRTVLLATGKQRHHLKLPGFDILRGKGISFCATCDGFFYRKKTLALVGSGEFAASELEELRNFTDDITIFTNGAEITSSNFPQELKRVTEPITSFNGTEKLESLTTADGRVWPTDGVFVALGTAGAADFAAKLGLELRGQDIVVNHEYSTNLPGIWAAGDCIGGYLQVAKAVADGALAAKNMIASLRSN